MKLKKIFSCILAFLLMFFVLATDYNELNCKSVLAETNQNFVYFNQNEGCGGYSNGAYDKSAVQPTAFNWTRQSQFRVGNNPNIKWTFEGGGKYSSNEILGIVIGNDGTIYSPGKDGLKAVDSKGNLKWTSKEGAFSAPAIAEDGTIYVSGEYHNFNAINPDGSTKWTFHNKDKSGYYHFTNLAIASDGTVVTGCSDGWIHGINGDGTERWSFFTHYPKFCVSYYSAPSIDSQGVAWVRLDDGRVQGVDKLGADAGAKWGGYWGEAALSKEYGDYFTFTDEKHFSKGQPAIAKDGTKYVNSYGTLIAYSSKGPIKWTYNPFNNDNLQVKAKEYGFSSPIIDADGVIYFSSGNRVYAISSEGSKIWSIDLKSTICSSPAIGSDGTLYFADSDNLYAIGGGVPQDVQRKAAENVNRPLKNQTGINPYNREDILKGTPGIINGTDSYWKQNTVLGQRGDYPFAGIYEFNNLTIDDNVEVTSAGISQLVIKVKGTLTLGKNAVIRVRNGYYSDAPKYKISSLSEDDLNNMGLDAEGFRVYPYLYGKGGDGGKGYRGNDRKEDLDIHREVIPGFDPITESEHKSNITFTNAGDGGCGGGGGYGGGKGGDYGSAGNGGGTRGSVGKDNGGDGGVLVNLSSDYNTGKGGTDIGLGTSASNPAFGCGGGGNGGDGCVGYGGNAGSGAGGGGGGYGGGVLTIIASSIKYDKDNPPHFIVSGQLGGLNGTRSERAGNGEGGLLIIQCPDYESSQSHWNLYSDTWGTHFTPSQNGGHGVVVGNPAKVIIKTTPFTGKFDTTKEPIIQATPKPIVNPTPVPSVKQIPKETVKPTPKPKNKGSNSKKTNTDASNLETGNTVGNNANTALVAEKNGYVYYADYHAGGKIYKMKQDGTQRTKINNEISGGINVIGNWIYYLAFFDNAKHLCKIKTDGTGEQKLADNVMGISVVGDWIYYILMPKDYGFDGKIYKMKTDGTMNTKLTDDSVQCMNVVDDWIYYTKSPDEDQKNSEIYKISIDGTQKTQITSGATPVINTVGNWIYYCNAEDLNMIYKIGTDGSNKTKVNSDVSDKINVVGNWIYYKDLRDGNKICKITTDGLQKTVLVTECCGSMHVAGDYIYYYLRDDVNQQLYKVKTDGSGNVKVE